MQNGLLPHCEWRWQKHFIGVHFQEHTPCSLYATPLFSPKFFLFVSLYRQAYSLFQGSSLVRSVQPQSHQVGTTLARRWECLLVGRACSKAANRLHVGKVPCIFSAVVRWLVFASQGEWCGGCCRGKDCPSRGPLEAAVVGVLMRIACLFTSNFVPKLPEWVPKKLQALPTHNWTLWQ